VFVAKKARISKGTNQSVSRVREIQTLRPRVTILRIVSAMLAGRVAMVTAQAVCRANIRRVLGLLCARNAVQGSIRSRLLR